MNRSSLIHYIDPSAIGITPNVNNSANDLEVYIAQGCKIQVYCPRVGLDFDAATNKPQEWTLKGRNRRLADSSKPYTVYARLNMQDKGDGYLVFAPKQYLGEKWVDKYVYVTPEGLSKQGYDPDTEEWWPTNRSFQYWYFKLGDVSMPENGERTVDIDTGLLGTEEFNNKWALNPDSLPLRIELQSTIADDQQPPVTRDGGTTPYVYWGETLTLTALLTEGWTGTDIQRFDHWEIRRDSGDAVADAAWAEAINEDEEEGSFRSTGIINLIHGRGAETRDDFNSAVNTTFTVMAMERIEEATGNAAATVTDAPATVREYAVLKQASFCIMAEVWEGYELSADTLMVTFNPRNGQYSPSGNIKFRIRATDQKSDVFMMTNGQYAAVGLHAEYAPIDDSQNWTPITISGSESATAEGEVPATAFSTNQKSINVRLKNAAMKELDRFTIAFLKDGEDSREREWIYRLDTAAGYSNTTGTIGGDPSHPVSGQTGGVDNCRLVDDFVPENWTDEPTGTSSNHDTEYASYRDYDHDNDRWGAFTTPKPWSHYGQDGDDGLYYKNEYARSKSRTSHAAADIDTSYGTSGWGTTAPSATDTYPYIWKRTRQWNPNTNDWATGSSWTYVCETGEDGPAGSNGDTPMQAFQWNQSPTSWPTPKPTDGTLGDWSPTAPNRPSGTGEYYLWMTQTVKHVSVNGTVTYDTWSDPVRISGNNGTNGEDASDQEFVYIRLTTYPFPNSVTKPADATRGKVHGTGDWIPAADQYETDDWVPEGWSDTAMPATENEKYVYAAIRKKSAGHDEDWDDFDEPFLWSNWGVQGIDGDGVQYVYKLFDHELTAAERESNIPTKPQSQTQGEWIPTGWSDDPLAPTVNMQYCYCSTIKKIGGSWADTFDTLGLWSRFSKDGQSAYKSTMFVRLNTTPTKPANNKGSYNNPSPSDCPAGTSGGSTVYWSDGIPSGEAQIWATSRIFTNDGTSPQQSSWSTPQPMSDTNTFDVEFAVMQTNDAIPAIPTANNRHKDAYPYGYEGQVWFDPDLDKYSAASVLRDFTQMYWRAERECKNGDWGDWTIQRIKGEKGDAGTNGDTPMQAFQWNQSPTSWPTPKPTDGTLGDWSLTAPNRPSGTGEYYLWMTQTVKHTAADGTVTYDTWSDPVRISGNNGTNGEDGTDYEYIYILKTAQYTFPTNEKPANISTGEVSPGGHAASGSDTNKQQDDWVPNGWWDNPQGIDATNKFEYMSLRVKPKGSDTWGAFSEPFIWSHWGRNGMDGDGTEYVFIRTKNNVPPVMDSTQSGYTADEFRPTITAASQAASDTEQAQTTDDPRGTDETYKYEWVAKRNMTAPDASGQRTWKKFTGENNDYKMSLWGNYAESAPYYVVDYGRASSRSLNQQGTPSGFDSTTGWQNTAPATSDNFPYIWERSRYYNSAGTLQSTSYTCLTGETGDDGISVFTDPTNILIRQVAKPQGNTRADFGLPMDVGFAVKEGKTAGTVTDVYIQSAQGLTVITPQSDHTKAQITDVVPTGTVYPDKGHFNCRVYYTINGISKQVDVKVPVYIDLMGSVVTTIEGDVETTVAHDIGYAIDPSGGIQSLDQVGTYIRSASEMTSELSKKVGEGKNLLTGVLTGEGWQLLHNGTRTNIETNDEDKFVIPSGYYLESPERNYSVNDGYYALSYEAPAHATIGFYDTDNNLIDVPRTRGYVNGRRYIIFNTVWEDEGEEKSLDTDAVIRFSGVSYIRHPQLETGEVATAFEAGTSETSSRIHQTAEQIEELVNDTGVNIVDKTISLYADKVKFYKNKSAAQAGDPVKIWVDGGDGSLHAVDGHFEGTVKATNFYHNVCIFTEGVVGGAVGYSYSKYYCTSAPEGYSFQQGEYYTADEIRAEIGFIPYQNFAQCVYDADVVHMIPTSGSVTGANWGSGYEFDDSKKTVTLPDPADFEGKIIEVYCDYYGERSAGSAYIDCVQPNSFASHIHLGTDGNTLSVSWEGSKEVVEGGVTVRFLSIEAYYDQKGETKHRWLIMGTSYDYPILEQLLQAHFDNRYQRKS